MRDIHFTEEIRIEFIKESIGKYISILKRGKLYVNVCDVLLRIVFQCYGLRL